MNNSWDISQSLGKYCWINFKFVNKRVELLTHLYSSYIPKDGWVLTSTFFVCHVYVYALLSVCLHTCRGHYAGHTTSDTSFISITVFRPAHSHSFVLFAMLGITFSRWDGQFSKSLFKDLKLNLACHLECETGEALQWRHNERDSVSNHRRLNCLLNRLFRYRSN